MITSLLSLIAAEAPAAKTDTQAKPAVTKADAKKTETKDSDKELFTLYDLKGDQVLGRYEDGITKKMVNITRKDVIDHLKAVGFDLSVAQPKSKIHEIESTAAAVFGATMYVTSLAKKENIDKEMAERIQFMTTQLIFSRYMEKRVMEKLSIEDLKKKAEAEVIKKRSGEYCYDIFMVATKTEKEAQDVIKQIEELTAKKSENLPVSLEKIAEEAQKSLKKEELKAPALMAIKETNGWLLPRSMLIQESGESGKDGKGGDLVFLIKELLMQFLGKDISEQLYGKNGKTYLKTSKLFKKPFKMEGHYVVVYVVNSKPFEKLNRLVEMFAGEELRRMVPKAQKEAQSEIIKKTFEDNKKAVVVVDQNGKDAPLPEKVLQMLGFSM